MSSDDGFRLVGGRVKRDLFVPRRTADRPRIPMGPVGKDRQTQNVELRTRTGTLPPPVPVQAPPTTQSIGLVTTTEAQSIPDATPTQVLWESILPEPNGQRGWDDVVVNDGAFPTPTLKVPMTGYLWFDFTLLWDTFTGGGTVELVIDRGGTELVATMPGATGSGQQGSWSWHGNVQDDDLLSVRVTQASGEAQTLGFAECWAIVMQTTKAAPGVLEPAPPAVYAYQDEVAADGPISFWKFDEESGTTAIDYGTLGNDATYQNGVVLGASTLPGIGSAAATLDGADDFIDAVDQPGYSLDEGTDGWTIEFWIKTPDTGTGLMKIVTKGGSGYEWDVNLNGANGGVISTSIYQASGSAYLNSCLGSVVVDDDQWHHVAMVFDAGLVEHRIYVDGVLDGTGGHIAGKVYTGQSEPIRWGKRGDNADAEYSGLLAGGAVYDKMLTPARILTHYNAGVGVVLDSYESEVMADSPVGYWRLGEASGDALDSSGNGYDLPEAGGPSRQVSGIANSDAGGVGFAGVGHFTRGETAAFHLSSYTLEGWARWTGANTVFISVYDSSNSNEFGKGWRLKANADGTVGFQKGSGDGSWEYCNGVTTGHNDGQWHHIVATYDGTQMKIYVDGELDNTVADTSGTSFTNATGFTIGRNPNGANSPGYSTGEVDEVAIYGTVLTPARILAHYEAGRGAFDPLADIAWHSAFWAEDSNWTPPADGAAVSSWRDASGNGRDATQADGLKQPLYAAAVPSLNNRPAIQGNVGDGLQQAAFTALSQPVTIVCVVRLNSTGTSMVFHDGRVSGNRMQTWSNGSQYAQYAGSATIQGGTPNTAAHLVISTFDATDTVEVDGVQVLSGTAGSHTLTGLTILNDHAYSSGVQGYMGFLGLYDGVLSAAQKADLLAWAQSHYGTP